MSQQSGTMTPLDVTTKQIVMIILKIIVKWNSTANWNVTTKVEDHRKVECKYKLKYHNKSATTPRMWNDSI